MHPFNRRKQAKARLDNSIRAFAPRRTPARDWYWRLVSIIRAASQLLEPVGNAGRSDAQDWEQTIRACNRISHFWPKWIRSPESWTAPDGNSCVQFRALVNHLFAKRPTPNFIARIWLSDEPWERQLFLHLAAGKSLRKFQMPLAFQLSREAARSFMQAPDDLAPMQALRWAQVQALGGDQQLARLLSFSPLLAAPTDHEEFWETVILFLVGNSHLPVEEVIEIVTFIHQQKFQPGETLVTGAGREPLQPSFSLDDRTLGDLRRHMINWRAERQSQPLPPPPKPSQTWERTPIGSFRYVEGKEAWTIDELLSANELRVEGRIMRHCVATYIHRCVCRTTSIWSMKVHESGSSKRVLTIEVIPGTRLIRQVKGLRNSTPTATAQNLLRQWALQEDLRFEGIV